MGSDEEDSKFSKYVNAEEVRARLAARIAAEGDISELCAAVMEGDVAGAEILLKEDKGIVNGICGGHGYYSSMTPMHMASANGSTGYLNSTSFVELFLNNKADITILDAAGMSALHLAAGMYGMHTIVPLLINNSPHLINLKDSVTGRTALHFAAVYGRIDIINMLIERGADVNIEDLGGATALDLAHLTHKLASVSALSYATGSGRRCRRATGCTIMG